MTASADDFRRARALADKLMASNLPSEYADEIDALTRAECQALDSIALECAVCNLWFPAAQVVDDGSRYLCRDCA